MRPRKLGKSQVRLAPPDTGGFCSKHTKGQKTVMTPKPSSSETKSQLSCRRGLRSFGVLALGASTALGLAACGSSGNASGSNKPTTTTKTALNSSHASSSSKDTSRLCAQISAASKAFGKLNLSSPSSATSAEAVLSGDFSRLESALHRVDTAGQKKSGSESTMISDVKTGVHDMNAAFAQFGKGNLGTAKRDFYAGLRELRTAKHYGTKANIRACM
jgi:hypothetical protein